MVRWHPVCHLQPPFRVFRPAQIQVLLFVILEHESHVKAYRAVIPYDIFANLAHYTRHLTGGVLRDFASSSKETFCVSLKKPSFHLTTMLFSVSARTHQPGFSLLGVSLYLFCFIVIFALYYYIFAENIDYLYQAVKNGAALPYSILSRLARVRFVKADI